MWMPVLNVRWYCLYYFIGVDVPVRKISALCMADWLTEYMNIFVRHGCEEYVISRELYVLPPQNDLLFPLVQVSISAFHVNFTLNRLYFLVIHNFLFNISS